jgi:hypothetical protein
MIARVAIEVVLGVVTFLAGGIFWQFPKRAKFLKAVICNELFLRGFVTRSALESPSPMNAMAAQKLYKDATGYVINIKILFDADKISQRRPQMFLGTIVLASLLGSYFLGPIYLAINIGIFLLVALVPIFRSTQINALDQVVAIALILHKWHLEDAAGCVQWIDQASSLRPLYNAVTLAD